MEVQLTSQAASIELDANDEASLVAVATANYGAAPGSMSLSHSNSPAHRSSRKRKSSGLSDDGDHELRRLAEEYLQRPQPVEEMAARIRQEEANSISISISERSRQTFGMVWLMKSCQLSAHSAIPRNRIYARYVETCAQQMIKPMNPAAFGKLVKAIFPDIKTRRLGVRGHSKYHYCGITILGDTSVPTNSISSVDGGTPQDENRSSPDLLGNEDNFESGSMTGISQNGGHNNRSDKNLTSPSRIMPDLQKANKNDPIQYDRNITGGLYVEDNVQSLDAFAIPSLNFLRESLTTPPQPLGSLILPNIEDYAPAGTDKDSVAILAALCKSHCSSLLDAVRFMHLKQFLNTLSSFHGTLTMPVQRLLKVPGILVWIQRCDWIMYKEMIRMLTPLALQAVPTNVLVALRSLSMALPQNISTAFKSLPQAFVQVKLRPAYAFSNLIGRLLRVNETANAAAKILANPLERQLMLKDWMEFVDAKSIVLREVPCGGSRALKIISEDVAVLLNISDSTVNDKLRSDSLRGMSSEKSSPSFRQRNSEVNEHEMHNDISGSKHGEATAESEGNVLESNIDSTGEGIIEKWAQYLTNLPAQFPDTSARMFLLYMNGALTAALREITLNGGEAFGAWWMVRCWIDEWIAWIAEQGGFLSTDFIPMQEFNSTPTAESDSMSASLQTTAEESNEDFGFPGTAFNDNIEKDTNTDNGNTNGSIIL
ncbi:RFX DNA-binding domain-containing protein [Dipodascopsis uninucleata]